jgi:spermidine synthase
MVALAASVLLALIPFVARPLLNVGVEALDSVSAGAFAGSLAAVLVLVAIPVLLLGTVSPWALRLSVTDVEQAGAVSGRLYALGTAGSLVGTLSSSLLFIPLLGTRRTFLVFALAIAITAVAGLRPMRRWALAPAAIAALMVLPVGTLKAQTDPGARVVYEADTEYQYARVIDRPDGSRVLELNEGQAIHSLYRPNTVLTGDYWDGHLVLPFLSQSHEPRRVAILGNAAGTTARAYGQLFPRTRVDAVEIDPEVSEIGRKWFGMKGPRLHVYDEDARPFLRRSDAKYDAISVDAYRQPYIPFYLTTREFFETVQDHLAPGGVVIINVGHPEGQDKLEKVLSATLGDVFGYVMRYPIEPTNTLLVAGDRPLSAARLRAMTPSLPEELRPVALQAASRVAAPLKGGTVYTDDDAPVEWLIDSSIVDYAED